MVSSLEKSFQADLLQGDRSSGHHAGRNRDQVLNFRQRVFFRFHERDGNPARLEGCDGFLDPIWCRERLIIHGKFPRIFIYTTFSPGAHHRHANTRYVRSLHFQVCPAIFRPSLPRTYDRNQHQPIERFIPSVYPRPVKQSPCCTKRVLDCSSLAEILNSQPENREHMIRFSRQKLLIIGKDTNG